jgi:hypothetical protein
MIPLRLACGLLLMVFVAPHGAADPTIDPLAPVSVTAVVLDGVVDVTWVPGLQPADSFNVYGVDPSGALTFIQTMPSNETKVALSQLFPNYAVSGIAGTTESSAARTSVVPCISAELFPPSVGVGSCGPGL